MREKPQIERNIQGKERQEKIESRSKIPEKCLPVVKDSFAKFSLSIFWLAPNTKTLFFSQCLGGHRFFSKGFVFFPLQRSLSVTPQQHHASLTSTLTYQIKIQIIVTIYKPHGFELCIWIILRPLTGVNQNHIGIRMLRHP